MAEMFETIAATIRERFRLEGKINGLTSQGKLWSHQDPETGEQCKGTGQRPTS
jgi:hypothetical protein